MANRKKPQCYMVTNNILEMIFASHIGFCVIPVVNSAESEPFEMYLIEKLIIKLR
jgi:hypothetical protein